MSQPTFDAESLYAALKAAIGAGAEYRVAGDESEPGYRFVHGSGSYGNISVTLQPNGSVLYQRFAGGDGDKGLIAYWGPDGSDVLGAYEAADVEVLHRLVAALALPTAPPPWARDAPRWSELLQISENDDEFSHVAVGTWGGRLFLLVEDVAGDNDYWRTELHELRPGVAGHAWEELWAHTWDEPGSGDWSPDFQDKVRAAIVDDTAGFLAALAHGEEVRVRTWLGEQTRDPCLFAEDADECKRQQEEAELNTEYIERRYGLKPR